MYIIFHHCLHIITHIISTQSRHVTCVSTVQLGYKKSPLKYNRTFDARHQ